jgi:NAD(P)-dependent dehydrogenase (short-subunit alcohol dehydrogenase family)
VITGASTGIGRACAIGLAERGFRVFAGIRAAADGERLLRDVPAGLTPVRIDVTDRQSIAAAAGTVGEAIGEGGLAGLVNNAGIVVAGPLEVLPVEALREQFEVNVIGQITVTQAFLPLLRRRPGRIVLMGSVAGRFAPPYLGPYAASKHALEALSDALRLELRGFGIFVSIIEPGNTETPIWSKSAAACERLAEETPPELTSLYERDMAIFRDVAARRARGAVPVEHVIRAVVHALCAPRPRTRYPIGARVRARIALFKFLPDRLRDWLVRKAMGLR